MRERSAFSCSWNVRGLGELSHWRHREDDDVIPFGGMLLEEEEASEGRNKPALGTTQWTGGDAILKTQFCKRETFRWKRNPGKRRSVSGILHCLRKASIYVLLSLLNTNFRGLSCPSLELRLNLRNCLSLSQRSTQFAAAFFCFLRSNGRLLRVRRMINAWNQSCVGP